MSAGRPHKAFPIVLWIAQVALALMFGMAGIMKATSPMVDLATKMAWTAALPEVLVRFIGVSELAGALGLILPSVTRIQPRLTPLAAMGLVTVMLLASAFHLSRGEAQVLPINFTLAGLAALVAWGRLKRAPISPRSAPLPEGGR